VLLGEYRHSIDAKGRVSLPARFRASLGGTVVVARGFGRELVVYTPDGYEGFLGKLLAMDGFKNNVRDAKRYFTANAHVVDLDKSGRLNLPASLAAWAGLECEAVVVGTGDHAEIWSPAEWEGFEARTTDIASIAEEFSDLGVI
jgi:MraZ protein